MLKLSLGKSQYKLEKGSRHSGKGKTMQTVKDQCLRGVRKGGMNRSTENFRAVNYFVRYYNDGYGSWIYLSKPIECIIPKANTNVNAHSSAVKNTLL